MLKTPPRGGVCQIYPRRNVGLSSSFDCFASVKIAIVKNLAPLYLTTLILHQCCNIFKSVIIEEEKGVDIALFRLSDAAPEGLIQGAM